MDINQMNRIFVDAENNNLYIYDNNNIIKYNF